MGKKKRIGYNRDFYPLAHGNTKQASGIIVDIVKMAFARMDCQVDFVPRSLDNLSRHFADSDIEGFAGIAITDDRRQQVIFSVPLIDSGGAWFQLSGAQLSPQSAATPSAGPLLAAIKSHYPEIDVQGVPTYRNALEMVVAGEVDAAALNLHVGSYQAVRNFPSRFSLPPQPFLPLQLGVAFNQNSDLGLISNFDAEVEAMRSDGKVSEIVRRYTGLRK